MEDTIRCAHRMAQSDEEALTCIDMICTIFLDS